MTDSPIIDGIVTDFVAAMKRIGALSEDDRNEFLDRLDLTDAASGHDGEYIGGMETIEVYFG